MQSEATSARGAERTFNPSTALVRYGIQAVPNETERPRGKRVAEVGAYRTISSSQQKAKEVDHLRRQKGKPRHLWRASSVRETQLRPQLEANQEHEPVILSAPCERRCVWTRERAFLLFECVASVMTLHDSSFLDDNLICDPAEHCDFPNKYNCFNRLTEAERGASKG